MDQQSLMDAQMSDLTPEDDFDFDWDNNDISGSLSNNFAEWNVELRLNTGIDLTSVEGTLNGVGTKLATGLQGTYNDAVTAFTEVKEDIEQAFKGNPLENAFNFITGEIDEALNALSNLSNPDTYLEGLEYFGKQFGKTMLSQIISGAARAAGAGAFAGPIGMLGTTLISSILSDSDHQIGMPGMAFKDEGFDFANPISTTVSYFDKDGKARDDKHRQVFTPGAHGDPAAGNPMYGTPTKMESLPEFMKDVEGMMGDPYGQVFDYEDAKTASKRGDEDSTAPSAPVSPEGPQYGDPDMGDIAEEEAVEDDLAAAAAESAAQNAADVQAAVDAASAAEEQSDSEGGGGAAGDDSGKIICTMMNRMYGLGEYRIKQWLLYSKRHLKDEHQLGYHKLYCNLVAKMPTNRILAKILSHLADKRTDDIVAEMKGTERSWLGRFYRATLIDGPSYIVGTMIKKNWLKPADISVLQKI